MKTLLFIAFIAAFVGFIISTVTLFRLIFRKKEENYRLNYNFIGSKK